MTSTYRVGVDIGGTFTDGVYINDATGAFGFTKVATTPDDPALGYLQAVEKLVVTEDIDPKTIAFMCHATTIATNAVIQKRGARTGLLITEGFRDVLGIARQIRHELYNLQTDKPPPLVPRQWCLEVEERLNFRGEILKRLDTDAVREAGLTFREDDVESIAICFLHSYQNPEHEELAARILAEVYPAAQISLSSVVAPEIREYWRASTTVIDAYVSPLTTRYLDAVERGLARGEVQSELHLMQSSGGIMSSAVAKRRPALMVESGPAAGVAAAAYFAQLVGKDEAISFDMGGTTAKMGLIRGGRPQIIPEFEVGGRAGAGAIVRGSGYPLLGSMVDLVEVGAGGGSAAWIDSGGAPRVGPESAGAIPGPACYLQGGTRATVTDANLLLGRINPDYFLGGEITLSLDAAHSAMAETFAAPLGLDVTRAAMGVLNIANATMVQAMRLVSVERGYDPRHFSLIATGGSGPLHAGALAAELGIPTVIVPPSPGVASALGLLVSDLRQDFRRTHLEHLDVAEFSSINRIHEELESIGRTELIAQGVHPTAVQVERYLDMRYVGQSWKLPISTKSRALRAADAPDLKNAFDGEHATRYGYSVATEPVEIVNIGLSALGSIPKPKLSSIATGGRSAKAAIKDTRPVYFAEAGDFVPTPILDRYRLEMGNTVSGPCVIEERDSTILVEPGFEAEVVEFGVILLRWAQSPSFANQEGDAGSWR